MRQPQPYWKATHRCWYAKIDGRHYRLDPNEKEAWEKYHQLMAGRAALSADSKVAELVNRYLDWTERHRAKATYEWYARFLLSFGRSLPRGLKLSKLRPFYVTLWVDSAYPPATCSPSTRHGAIRAVQRVFNWAIQQGLADSNPLRRIEKPRPNRRETYLTPKQYQALTERISGPFRDMIEILRHTGCRPEEARKVTSAEFDQSARCWILPAGFTSKVRRRRSIPLDSRALKICAEGASQFPEGPILRLNGRPWNPKTLSKRCRKTGAELGFEFSPYTIRHTFATDAIIRGVDLVTIAEIMGHSDLRMLQGVYQHVNQRLDHLRKGLEQATSDLYP